MATSNKSKAKTKTTKKVTKKSSASSTSKKATASKVKQSKASSAKANGKSTSVDKSSLATSPTKPVVKVEGSKSFISTAVIFVVLASLASYFMKATTVQIFLGHLTKNELASTAGTVLVAAARPLCEIQIKWMLVGLLIVSAILVVLRSTVWERREQQGIKFGVQPLRWVDFAITGALMFQIVALVNGLQDLVALKLGAFSIALVAYFAWMYERENAATGKPARASLIGAKVTALIPVLMLGVTMLGTIVYGIVRSPWYAYVAVAVFVAWLGFVLIKLNRTTSIGKHDYLASDRAYNTVSILAKVILALVLIAGLYVKK